jgi:hypothetical protein
MLGFAVFLVWWVSSCTVNHVAIEGVDQTKTPSTIPISIQPCIDRTGTTIADLGKQATMAFEEHLGKAKEYKIHNNGKYVLSCEVTNYLPGNAAKRWVMPGWGTTVGKVTAMIQDAQTDNVLIIIEGNANIGVGGLYSVGAWQYIVPVAVQDVVNQLIIWARRE